MRWLGFPSLEFFSEEGPAGGIGKQVLHRAYRPIRNDIGFLLLALVSLALVPPREDGLGRAPRDFLPSPAPHCGALTLLFHPFGVWLFIAFFPTACAVGCILAPLRGFTLTQASLRLAGQPRRLSPHDLRCPYVVVFP
jgi:hypothetical protein